MERSHRDVVVPFEVADLVAEGPRHTFRAGVSVVVAERVEHREQSRALVGRVSSEGVEKTRDRPNTRRSVNVGVDLQANDRQDTDDDVSREEN